MRQSDGLKNEENSNLCYLKEDSYFILVCTEDVQYSKSLLGVYNCT